MSTKQLVKCHTDMCVELISTPASWNNYNLWCGICHQRAHGIESKSEKQARLQNLFALRVSQDGHRQRGNY